MPRRDHHHEEAPGRDDAAVYAQYAAAYPPLLTRAQAAALAGRAAKTVSDWSARGLLDAVKVGRGRAVRFRRDGLVAFLLNHFDR